MSLRGRMVDRATAVVVAVGVVASIPMIPILIIGWLLLIVRSPAGGFGLGVVGATRAAAEEAAPGKLEGFNGALLFPIVGAGWFLIALIVGGLLGSGDLTRSDDGAPGVGLVVGTCLFIGPTLLAYRSMYPATHLDEWLGSRQYGRMGIPLVTWIAACWLVWSITTWTTFVGGEWTTFCTFVLICLAIVLPGVFILIKPTGGRRLYLFIGGATVVGLVSVGAYVAGLTPSPRWP
jgi:hypothetical protein